MPSGHFPSPVVRLCPWCGLNFQATKVHQKYHPECGRLRTAARAKAWRQRNPEKCTEINSEYSRGRYRLLRRHKLCVQCKGEPLPKELLCWPCRQKARAKNRAYWHRKKAAA